MQDWTGRKEPVSMAAWVRWSSSWAAAGSCPLLRPARYFCQVSSYPDWVTRVTCTLDCDELKALVIACSVVRLALLADSQKVMPTVPLWLARALRLQVGRVLAAPAVGVPAETTAAAVAVVTDAMTSAAAVSRERRAVRMSIA